MALDDRALDVHLRLLAEADGSALRRSHAVDRLVRALAELGLAERARRAERAYLGEAAG